MYPPRSILVAPVLESYRRDVGPERVRYLGTRGRSGTERVSYLAPVGRSTLQSSRAGASGRFRTSLKFPFRQDDHFLLLKSPNVSKYLQKLQRMLKHLIKTYVCNMEPKNV
ncbi:hypothetical protein F2Q69_00050504 [Brassica cretica]|uniref:Uncharacterized protein n=1 Tax=Brassica cretica TaxID=69181 RepID=A0A8S9PSS1_BRACR|nr:hypothetical protein F2Q69_00050504 [Brassica cretica]